MAGSMCFTVRAAATAQTLSRIVNHFAQRDFLPSKVVAKCNGSMLDILIEQPELDEDQAEIIAAKMRASVLVETVSLSLST